jgi:hypothetical protein
MPDQPATVVSSGVRGQLPLTTERETDHCQRGGQRRARISAPTLAAVGVAAATAADVAFDPAHRDVPMCPFHAAFGWWCPLCGGLRAANALARGDLGAALHANAVLVCALPLLALYWLDWRSRSKRGLRARPLGRVGVAAVVAVLVLFTVVRNLPVATALRP